jgi:Fe-Mn family superoxide dismutase
MTRREFLGRTAALAGGVSLLGLPALGRAAEMRAPLVPGKHEVMPLPFKADALRGISEQVVMWHHGRHYTGYVNARNAIEVALAAMDPRAAGFEAKTFGGLKRQETFNACGQILHENYFTVLGGDGQAMSCPVTQALARDFGSVEAWQADLTAVANAAGIGWGVTTLDPSSGRLRNFLVELHQNGAVWAGVPLVALDGWEHAFYHDYGPDKGKYLEAFFRNLHWGRIDGLYRKAMD